MRRSGTRYFRSFTSGLMLAALPVAAFLGADYLLAPPSQGIATDAASSVARFASRTETAPAATARETSQPAQGSRARVSSPVKAPAKSGEEALVLSIQQELTRVGCYAGASDGTWSEQTQSAMRAFNTSVRVNMPTGQPDYILLTLLQGHSAKACSPVPRSIEARAVIPSAAPVTAAERPAPAAPAKSWSTTTVASAPIVVVPSDRPALKPIDGSRPIASAPSAEVPLAGEVQAAAAPLPGRMAVGAPPPTDGVAAPAPVAVRDVRAAPPPRSRPASGRAPRVQRMFSDLSKSAP